MIIFIKKNPLGGSPKTIEYSKTLLGDSVLRKSIKISKKTKYIRTYINLNMYISLLVKNLQDKLYPLLIIKISFIEIVLVKKINLEVMTMRGKTRE